MVMFIKFNYNSSLCERVINLLTAILVCPVLSNVASLYFSICSTGSCRNVETASRLNPPASSLHLGETSDLVARRSISGTANAIVKHEILQRQGKFCFVPVAFCALRARVCSLEEERKFMYFGTGTRCQSD